MMNIALFSIIDCSGCSSVESEPSNVWLDDSTGIEFSVESISDSENKTHLEEKLPLQVGNGLNARSNKMICGIDWIKNNLYRISSYRETDNGEYEADLIEVEEATIYSFDLLRKVFYACKYTNDNHYCLLDGVNCQGMTCYLVDWCRKNNHEFKVIYSENHVYTEILHDGDWYAFNFTLVPKITLKSEGI